MRIVNGIVAGMVAGVVVGLVVAGGVLFAAPAYAHVALAGSDPADGRTQPEPPRRVVLRFTDEVDPRLTRVAVTVDGEPMKLPGPVRTRQRTVTVPLADLPTSRDHWAAYRVVYRVVGVDGHRIDGEIGFRVGTPSGDALPVPEERTVSRSGIWLVVGLGGVLLLGALAYVLTVGRRRDEDVSDGGDGIDPRPDAADPD